MTGPAVVPIVAAFVSPFGYTCLDALAAYMINIVGMSPFQVICFRNTIATTVLLPYLLWSREPHAPVGPPGTRKLLWSRGVVMTTSLTLVYLSLEFLTLAEFWMVDSCLPFPTALMCWWLLSEKFTRTQAVCCVLSLLGVLLIINPYGSGFTSGTLDDHIPKDALSKLVGISLGLLYLMTMSSEVVIMRVLGDRVSQIQVLATLAVVPSIISAILLAVSRAALAWPRTSFEWAMLAATVPCGWLAQFTVTYAAQYLSGVTVIMTNYTGLIHGTVIQWLMYGNLPNFVTTMGIIVIAVVGFYAAMYGQTKMSGAAGGDVEFDRRENDGEAVLPLLTRESRFGNDTSITVS